MISINRGQSCTIAIRLSNPLLIGDIESMQCFHSSGNPWFQPGPFWEDGIAFIKLSSQETLTLEDSFYVYFVIQSLTKGQRVSKRIQIKASTVHTPGNSSVNQGVDFVIEFIDPEYRGIEAWMAGYVKGDKGNKGDKGDRGEAGQRGPKGSSVLRVDIAGDNLIFYFDGGLPPQSVVVPAIQAANAAAASAAQSATDANASKLAAAQSALNAASSAAAAQTSAQNSAQSASTATTKASEAANSATSANTSAQSASSSALAASSHKDDAESSAQNASNSANSAQDSANVATQAKVDAVQAKNLTEAAKNAVDSAAAQVASDTQVATTKASEAASSATSAEFFANNAEDHASAAFSSRVLAQNSANSASISEGNAASSAQSAASSAQASAQSAQDANNSELEAESAATLSTEQFTLVSAARNEAVAAKIAAQNSEDTAVSAAATATAAATTATTQAGLAAAAANSTNGSVQAAAASASQASTSATSANASASSAASSAAAAQTSAIQASASATQAATSATQAATSATQAVNAAAGASQIVFQNIPTRPSRSPLFNFDFSGSGIADPRLTCVRSGSLATRVNRNGVIEVVQANTPRINFDPVTGQCLGLLVEPTRPNRFNPLVRSPYGILSATHVDGRRNTPMGTTTHCFGITTTSSDGRIINAVILETTQRVCISIFIPKTSGNELISTRAEIVNSGNPVPGSLHQFLFNQTTGQISNHSTGTNSGPSSAILVEDYPTFGWWRLSVTFNVVVNASSTYQIQLNPRTSAGTPSAGLTLDYFGWSCEEIGVNDFGPSSYIHGQGTRGGEEIVLPSLVSGLRGALAAEVSRVANNLSPGAIVGVQGSTTVSHLTLVNSPGSGVATFRNLDGTNPNLDATGVTNNSNVIRAFLSYSSTGRRLVVDNSVVQTSSLYTPNAGVLTIGSADPSISPRGHIRKLVYWANPVADIEMTAWTQYNSFGTLGGQAAANSDLGTASKMDTNAIQRLPSRLDMPFFGTGSNQSYTFRLDFDCEVRDLFTTGSTFTRPTPGTTILRDTNITVTHNAPIGTVMILSFLPVIQ